LLFALLRFRFHLVERLGETLVLAEIARAIPEVGLADAG
jgi:hypothetical protein